MSSEADKVAQGAKPWEMCTEVNQYCPVEITTQGYYPNKGINIFFTIAFAIALIGTLWIGIRKKTYSFTAFIAAGLVLEVAGYVGRVLLNSNPWNKDAFQLQICAIILAPTLICVSIYLTLKHVAITFSASLSRVRPNLYPYIFVPADVSCLLVQAIGGALAASGGNSKTPNKKILDGGNNAIIAGVALQVMVLLFFGVTGVDYWLRIKKWVKSGTADEHAVAMWNDRKVRMFIYAITGAYSCLMIRCIYRIIEMAGGWGNHIMQDEVSFIVLDGFMILIAVSLLTIFAPGTFFPQMAAKLDVHRSKRGKKKGEKSSVDGGAAGTDHSQQDIEMAQPASREGEKAAA